MLQRRCVILHFIFYHRLLVASLSSSKSCLLCSLRVTFCELPSHQFRCQTHFPFMRDFGKGGFKGLFVLVTWTSSVFRGLFFWNWEASTWRAGKLIWKTVELKYKRGCLSEPADDSSFRVPDDIKTADCNGTVMTLFKHLSGKKSVPSCCFIYI